MGNDLSTSSASSDAGNHSNAREIPQPSQGNIYTAEPSSQQRAVMSKAEGTPRASTSASSSSFSKLSKVEKGWNWYEHGGWQYDQGKQTSSRSLSTKNSEKNSGLGGFSDQRGKDK